MHTPLRVYMHMFARGSFVENAEVKYAKHIMHVVFRYVLFPARLPELASLCAARLHVTRNVVHARVCRD